MLKKDDIDRFYSDVENLGLKFPVAAIAEATGYSKGNVSDYLRRKKEPSANFINAFYTAFQSSIKVPRETDPMEPAKEYLVKRLELKNGDIAKNVPVYGGFTTLGNIEVFDDDRVKHKVIAELPEDVFPGCNYAEKAKGDSMYPLIMNQALLVGKTCTVKGISYGEKYIIKTRDGLDTTKFVHPGSNSKTLKLKAYNKSIPDQEIQVEDVVFACRIQWIINPT